jgi:hypothetical protein
MISTVEAIGPHQINELPDGTVTVTFPVGSDTVLSIQPDGSVETRPHGTDGPFERAILAGGRLIFAPLGSSGRVYIIPFASRLPNA